MALIKTPPQKKGELVVPTITMEQYDTLLHLSSETETAFRSINNFLLYFLLWTGGGRGQNQPTFMSMNQLTPHDVYDCGIDKYSQHNIRYTETPRDFTNYREQFLQGYWEVKVHEDYSAVSLKTAYPISRTIKLQGVNGNWCYLTKFRRYLDSKEFYFIQLTQTFGGYLNRNAYKAISELLQYIKRHFPGLYIITGDFNVQGHERIFEYYLGSREYHICPFYKKVTCNDNEGLGSPDGIVVSRELYPRVEYAVDFYSGYSYQHFILTAKMYANSNETGTFDVTSTSFENFLDLLKLQYGERDFFVGHEGIFDEEDKYMLGSLENIREVPIEREGPKTFTAFNMAEQLKKK